PFRTLEALSPVSAVDYIIAQRRKVSTRIRSICASVQHGHLAARATNYLTKSTICARVAWSLIAAQFMANPSAVAGSRVSAVRQFNRFYTRQIGVLQHGLLDSPFSLAEARVLFELAHRNKPTAAQLGTDLGLDAGYLSRILRGFERKELVRKARSADDGRERFLALTAAGRKAFAHLDA